MQARNQSFHALIYRVILFLLFAVGARGTFGLPNSPSPKTFFSVRPFLSRWKQLLQSPVKKFCINKYRNSQVLGGATAATYSIASVQSTNLGTYWVKVGNLNSAKESAHVNLSATEGVNSKIFTAVELEFATEAGTTYLIQSSPDLVTWTNFSDAITGHRIPRESSYFIESECRDFLSSRKTAGSFAFAQWADDFI